MRFIVPFIIFVIAISSCKETALLDDAGLRKIKQDTDYYCAEAKTWLRFTEKTPELKGYFFVDSGRAVVTRIPFTFEKKRKKFIVWYVSDKTHNVKITCFKINDNSLEFEVGDSNYVFVAEKQMLFPENENRYIEEISDKVNVFNFKYGNARGYYKSKLIEKISEDQYPDIIVDVGKSLITNFMMTDLDLDMDVYMPSEDKCKKRPLLVLYHGGAFMIGDKTSPTMKEFAEYMAKRGYVVASVNYRLGFWFVPGSHHFIERSIYRATQDAHASIRFLVANAEKFRIDTSLIYTAGNSAGGFIAMNVAMMKDDSYFPSRKENITYLLDDLGCLDCSTNKLKVPFKVKAVLNMWGALTHIRMLVENPALPLLCFHGNDDKIIPIGHDFPFANISTELSKFFTEKVFGSEAIYKYSKVTKTPVQIKIFDGYGHDPHVNEDGTMNLCYDTVKTVSRDFLYNLLKLPVAIVNGPLMVSSEDQIPEYIIANSEGNEVFWNVSGGKIINDSQFPERKRIIWYNGAEKEIKVAMRNRNMTYSFYSQKVLQH